MSSHTVCWEQNAGEEESSESYEKSNRNLFDFPWASRQRERAASCRARDFLLSSGSEPTLGP